MPCYWDPEQVLEIRGTARSGEIQCSGTNKYPAGSRFGERCRYEKWGKDQDHKDVQELLPMLSRRPVSEITLADLLILAELCLCRDNHAHQKRDLAERWQKIIEKFDHVEHTVHTRADALAFMTADAHQPRRFGLPNPPSTQNNSPNTSSTFSGPIEPPSPRAIRHQLAEKEKLAELQDAVAALELENKSLRAAEERLQGIVKDESQLKERAEREYKQMQGVISHLSSEKGNLDSLLQMAIQGRAEAEAKAKRRKQQLSDKDGLIQDLREAIVAQTISLSSARADSVAKDQDIQTLQQQLAAVRCGLEQLEAELEEVKIQSEVYRETMSVTQQARERERDQARADLKEAKRRLSGFERRLEGRGMVTLPRDNGDRQSWIRRLGRWVTGRTSHLARSDGAATYPPQLKALHGY
jgi:DNA repair exonuclease SbcCD ATPase subunit